VIQLKSFFLIFILSQFARAAFTIEGVSGGSYSEGSSGSYTLYGGIAGDCPVNSTTSTCNTCNTNSVVVCNQKNINPLLQISVSVKLPSAVNAVEARLFTGTSSDYESNPVSQLTTLTVAAASQTVQFPVVTSWGEVCAYDSNFNNDCTPRSVSTDGVTNFQANRKIYVWIDLDGQRDVDSDTEVQPFTIMLNHVARSVTASESQAFQTGVNACSGLKGSCGFALNTPGDEKINFMEFYKSASTPTNFSGAPGWYGVAFFYKQTTNVSTVTNSDSVQVSTYDSSYQIADDKITGLQNYLPYCVLMANVNKAQNIMLFNTGATNLASCATPSEVVGLLDDKHCFISTAAFGSDMAHEVQTFRQFRDQFLLNNSMGASFVKVYYVYGPKAANWISDSESLKFITRMLLYPFYYFSVLSLQYGLMVGLFVLMVSVIFMYKFNRVVRGSFMVFKKDFYKSKMNIVLLFLFFGSFVFSYKSYAIDGFTKTHKEERPGATVDGLIRIDKDGNYIYKVPPQNANQSSHLKIGVVSSPDISVDICQYNNETNCQSVGYEDIYEEASGITFEYIYEYYFVKTKGKLGAQVGFAAQYAEGNGRLVSDPTKQSVESFSFFTVPLYGGLVYRFEYKDRQVIVPYISGGGTYLVLAEKREDQSQVNAIGAPGFYASGGGLLNLSALDRDMGAEFETEYDIKNLWISAEYKFVSVNSEAFSLENGFFQAGMAFDF